MKRESHLRYLPAFSVLSSVNAPNRQIGDRSSEIGPNKRYPDRSENVKYRFQCVFWVLTKITSKRVLNDANPEQHLVLFFLLILAWHVIIKGLGEHLVSQICNTHSGSHPLSFILKRIFHTKRSPCLIMKKSLDFIRDVKLVNFIILKMILNDRAYSAVERHFRTENRSGS